MQISGERIADRRYSKRTEPRDSRVPVTCKEKQQAPVAAMELAGRESKHVTSER